jgi:hypothetical protein
MSLLERFVVFIVRAVATAAIAAGVWVVSPWFSAPAFKLGGMAMLGSSFWARVVFGVLLLFIGYVLFSTTSRKRTVRYGRWYWRDWDIKGKD